MEEREILDADVLRILQRGDLKGQIEKEKEENEWKLKIVFFCEEAAMLVSSP